MLTLSNLEQTVPQKWREVRVWERVIIGEHIKLKIWISSLTNYTTTFLLTQQSTQPPTKLTNQPTRKQIKQRTH